MALLYDSPPSSANDEARIFPAVSSASVPDLSAHCALSVGTPTVMHGNGTHFNMGGHNHPSVFSMTCDVISSAPSSATRSGLTSAPRSAQSSGIVPSRLARSHAVESMPSVVPNEYHFTTPEEICYLSGTKDTNNANHTTTNNHPIIVTTAAATPATTPATPAIATTTTATNNNNNNNNMTVPNNNNNSALLFAHHGLPYKLSRPNYTIVPTPPPPHGSNYGLVSPPDFPAPREAACGFPRPPKPAELPIWSPPTRRAEATGAKVPALRFKMLPAPVPFDTFLGSMALSPDTNSLEGYRRVMARWYGRTAQEAGERAMGRSPCPPPPPSAEMSALREWSAQCARWWEDVSRKRGRRGHRGGKGGGTGAKVWRAASDGGKDGAFGVWAPSAEGEPQRRIEIDESMLRPLEDMVEEEE